MKYISIKKFGYSILFSALFLLCASVLIYGKQLSVYPKIVDAQSTATSTITTRLSGYAWSENIGWISFKDGGVPVILQGDGSLVGYAWSENVGWVQFGGLSGFPNTTYGTNAKIAGGKLTGWARVVSGVAPKSTAVDNRGGFDGWISLSGSNYGTTLTGTKFGGYAWASDVVGWVDFTGVVTIEQKNPCTGSYGTIIPDGSNFTFFSPVVTDGTCTTEVKTCVNGVLSPNSPTYTELSCEQKDAECKRAGNTYQNGDKIVFYAKAIAGRGQTCDSYKAELECVDGDFKDSEGNINDLNKNLKCINNPSFIER
ncbi:MAG: hypothetical protein K9M11_04255 [Candidatus Pacebacteria bacterium]|nr:hypothetical protein [Candidatus Paceibacterota bacterium]